MPPLPPPAVGGLYTCIFSTVNGAFGFDVKTNGYASTVEGNRTIRVIPWAPVYSVVVQRGGINPLTRRYTAVVYTEADFIGLALQVNFQGTLVTPREASTLCNLDSIARGDGLDPGDPLGLSSITLNFTALQ